MRLIIEGESLKIQNFVEYLIENFKEKGKTHDIEIHIEDRYDKKLLDSREQNLKNKFLIRHADGFEIMEPETMTDFSKFKESILRIIDDESVIESLNEENYQNHFVHYNIRFVEQEEMHHFNFSFLELK